MEIAINKTTGKIEAAVPDDIIFLTWAEKIIRGTTGVAEIKFDPVLYRRYYTQVFKQKKSKSRRLQFAAGKQTSREMNELYPNFEFFDLPKMKIKKDPELVAAVESIREPKHPFADVPLTKTHVWGNAEMKGFILGYVADEHTTRQDFEKVKIDLTRNRDLLQFNTTMDSFIKSQDMAYQKTYIQEKVLPTSNVDARVLTFFKLFEMDFALPNRLYLHLPMEAFEKTGVGIG